MMWNYLCMSRGLMKGKKYEVQGTHSFAAGRLALREKHGVSGKSHNAAFER
jgi:hypothetical protein